MPAVHRILDEPRIARFVSVLGGAVVKTQIAASLAAARAANPVPNAAAVIDDAAARCAGELRGGLVGVINATGILLHTNLGRAPLAPAALAAIVETAGGASNLEFDLAGGTRGSRYDRLGGALRALTGADDALVVNNCAAAVLLILDTFARAPDGSAREVIIARNQLVEIGGGFRLPDVLARSGATLVEVGATNRVRIDDYARALSPRTALLMRAHRSNFRLEGFVDDVAPTDLAALAQRAGVPTVDDLGSGALTDISPYGLPHERTVAEAVAEGMDLVAFSGDKLLGGPQAGIIVGRAALIARLRANPLLRALRIGTVTLAALQATLRAHLDDLSRAELPLYAMLGASADALRARARTLRACVSDVALDVVETQAFVGGGPLPLDPLPSIAIGWRPRDGNVTAAAARLRSGSPPVVARVEDGRLLLDLRTIPPERDAELSLALQAANA